MPENSDRASRVLIVLTSHADLAGIRTTGYYVPEAAEPWQIFTDAGLEVTVASILGGDPPRDGFDEASELQKRFLTESGVTESSVLADIDPAAFGAVFFAGGHGTMWDFPDNPAVGEVVNAVHSGGGVVAAVCHGPAALVGIAGADDRPFLSGIAVTGFSNEEEKSVQLEGVVPFLLQEGLAESGGRYRNGPAFTDHVVADRRVVTGQNPQSAASTARAVVAELERQWEDRAVAS
ncbi:MAG: type 1 glutamine amidotransferase domain-containing protein [Nocardioides sp.]